MRLQSQIYASEMNSYIQALIPHIEEQVSQVLQEHLLPDSWLAHWQQLLKAFLLAERTSIPT